MHQRIYTITYAIFLVESILLILGILLNQVSYGVDVQTPFMAIGIAFALVVVSSSWIYTRKINTDFKKSVSVVLICVMVFLCFYYVLEDHFELVNFN